MLLVMFNVSPCILIGVSCYCLATTCVKNSKKNDTSQVACRHQGNEHLVLVKAKKTSQEQPHPHHPKLEAARLGLLHLRHFSHCAQVRLLAPVLVIVLARDHVSVYDQPLSKPLSHLLHDAEKSNSSPMSPASTMSTASSSSCSASASAMSASTASSTNFASSD